MPSVEAVLADLHLPYDVYASGAESLGLWFEDAAAGIDAQLHLTMASDGRFLVEYLDDAGRVQLWAAARETSTSQVVMVTGGNRWDLGDRFLLHLDQVALAVDAFLAGGLPAPGLAWEPDVEISEPY